MNAQPLVVLDAFGGGGPDLEKNVEAIRRQRQFFMADHLTALNRSTLGAGEIHRHALSPTGFIDGFSMDLETSHPKQIITRQTAHLFANLYRTAERGAGYDYAMALKDKCAVHRQAKVAGWGGLGRRLQDCRDQLFQLFETLAGDRRDRKLRRIFQISADRQNVDFLFHLVNTRWRHQIGFGDHENRHLNAEQMNDVKVFLGLRHDAIVGGHGEKNEIDAVGAGEHVLDEAFVAGHVDNSRRSSVG